MRGMARRARRHHGGSVRKLASGRWQVRVYDRSSGRHVSAGTYPTKADADAALAAHVADQQRGAWANPERGRQRLADYLTAWIEERSDLAASTRSLYRGLARKHVLPHLGDARLSDLDTAGIRRWHQHLARERSASIAAKSYRLLRAALNTAAADGIIAVNPCQVSGAGVERSAERSVATVAEVDQLANTVPERYRAMVLLAAWCGLRHGELAALTREDIDLDAATVRINKARYRVDGQVHIGPPKTEAGRRTVHMPAHVSEAVAAHLDRFTGPEGDALVFTGERGGPVERTHFNRGVWRPATEKAGLSWLRFHDLRHTGATLAAATGASVAELQRRLGHASPAAALRYQHATQDRDRAIAEALGRLWTSRGE